MTTVPAWAAVAAFAVCSLGCADSGDGQPLPEDCIGPAGATFEIDEPGSLAHGVRVTVPPGNRDGCLLLSLQSSFNYRYPNGFKAFQEGAAFYVGFFGELPEAVDLEISLSVTGLTPLRPMQVIAAFWRDPDAAPDTWHIVMPDEVSGDRMVLRTRMRTDPYLTQWSWGQVALDVVDDATLASAGQETYGRDGWAAITAELGRIYDTHLSGAAFDCAGLNALQSAFGSLMQAVEAPLMSYQQSLTGVCGGCDVQTTDLVAEFVEYVRLNALDWFWREIFLETDGVVRIYSLVRLMGTWDELATLGCDWDCFLENAYEGCEVDMAVYWLSWAIVELAEWGKGHLGCR